ncbi:MAG TPA: hypothetical protein VMZ26_06150, partial [Pyrinomonadaceae bacterium]|nr:hypothetical protein [Pyrinomonadaceae bacterium]
MKRCPECRRDYFDDTLSFCLEDGAELVYGVSGEEPATAVFGGRSSEGEFGVPPSGGQFGVPPSGGEFGVPPSGGEFGVPPSGGFADDVKTQLFEGRQTNENPRSALHSPQPRRPPEGGTPNSFDKRLLIGPIALVVALLAGFAGYRYFGSGSASQITSIAVLPFQNRSDDPDTDYLSDGL